MLAIRELLTFDYENCDDLDKKLRGLITKLKKHFGRGSIFKNIEKDGITIRLKAKEVRYSWQDIEKDILETRNKKGLTYYPIARILLAGIENHINNLNLATVISSEVDRAMDNRADSELLALREESKVESLWNYGAIAPLIGLFGTVTGITQAFLKISTNSSFQDSSKMVNELAGGIYEALYTTIFGLAVAIVLILFYYGYRNRLDWIYNQWKTITLQLTEKL